MGQERFPAVLLFGFLTPITGKLYVKLVALEDMVCLTGVDFGAGFFPRGRKLWCQWIGSLAWRCVHPDRRAEPVRASRVPPSDHFAAVERECGQGSILHKVHYSDADRHMSHKLDKQAISLYFVSAFAQSELSKTCLEIKTGMEGWLTSWWRRATRSK